MREKFYRFAHQIFARLGLSAPNGLLVAALPQGGMASPGSWALAQMMPPGGPGPGPGGAPGGAFGGQGAGPGGFQGPPPGGPFGPGPGGPGGPQGFQPFPQPPPKKKSRIGMIIGCGCLSMFLFVVSVGGSLLYFEEGKGLHVPDSEVASVPVSPGVPFSIDFKWEGTGYAFNNVWLVVEDGTKSSGDFKVKSKLKCRSGRGDERQRGLRDRNAHNVEDKGGGAFSAWIYLGDEYAHSSGYKITCTGTVEPVTGSFTRARIVVTQRQRPSDFFAN